MTPFWNGAFIRGKAVSKEFTDSTVTPIRLPISPPLFDLVAEVLLDIS
jgi:hypothetical protein